MGRGRPSVNISGSSGQTLKPCGEYLAGVTTIIKQCSLAPEQISGLLHKSLLFGPSTLPHGAPHEDDTNTIVTGRKRAARRRNCNGTTHPSRAVNSVSDEHELRRIPEAQCASEVGACTALAHSATAYRARPKSTTSVDTRMPSAMAEVVRTRTSP